MYIFTLGVIEASLEHHWSISGTSYNTNVMFENIFISLIFT